MKAAIDEAAAVSWFGDRFTRPLHDLDPFLIHVWSDSDVRYALTLVGVAGALAAAVVLPGHAGAAVPCWQQVIGEWSVGRLSLTHPIGCYREALKRAPTDLRVYSNLEEELDDAVHVVSIRRGRTEGTRVVASAASSSVSAAGPGESLSPVDYAAIGAGFVLVASVAVFALRRVRRS